jgi:four helix bundle protein
MSNNHEKLKIFVLSDRLVLDVYRVTRAFPSDERYGLQSQLRRASVSVPSNIVEGAARDSDKEYAHFLRVACGSASEARYLVSVAARLGYLTPGDTSRLEQDCQRLVRGIELLAQRVAASVNREK